MTRQSIQNIKLAILSLDGFILDLNRYRFNYYKKLCVQHNLTITKEEFSEQLSNMYDMYKALPLSSLYEPGVLNAKIERELFQFLSYKPLKAKEGVVELIEYFNQRNIKVAVISSHHTKYANEYIRLLKLNKKVDYVIGSDSSFLPIPSTQIINSILKHFDVLKKETLVLSSYRQLTTTAFQAKTNVIYCNDLVEADDYDQLMTYKCVNNAYEVLNCLLFDKIDEEDMYSSILGMDKYSSKSELDEIYQKLLIKYNDDPEILKLVHQTYQYHLIQFDELKIKDASIKQAPKKRFVFEDEAKEEKDKEEDFLDQIIKPTQIKEDKPLVKPLSSSEEDELTSLLSQIKTREIKKEEPKEETNIIKEYIEEQTKVINEVKEEEKEEVEEIKEEKKLPLIIRIILTFLSICLTSLCITFLGLVVAVLFINVWKNNQILSFLQTMFNMYYSVVELCFKSVFDTLNSFISIIPSYTSYMDNTFLSNEGMQLLNIFIFNSIIVALIELLIKVWRKLND